MAACLYEVLPNGPKGYSLRYQLLHFMGLMVILLLIVDNMIL